MYKKIMVPLDGSELAECVLPHVEAIAGGCGVDRVVIVRAVEHFQVWGSGPGFTFSEEEVKQIDAKNQASAQEYLDQIASRLKLGGAKVQTQILVGKADASLADYATHNDVDLIVVATHGLSGVSRWVWGSVADRLLHSACVPILMVRAPGCVPRV